MADSNREMCRMLHAYELGRLTEQEQEAFETHLLECNSCFEEVRQFENVAGYVATAKELVPDLETALQKTEPNESWVARLAAKLWPRTSLLLRPAVAYFLIVLLAYPAYLGLRQVQGDRIETVRQAMLLDTRSGPPMELTPDTRLLSFTISGYTPDSSQTLTVTILNESNKVVFEDLDYDGLDIYGVGHILLPPGGLRPGLYRLMVADPSDPVPPKAEYTLRQLE